jgi:hypothetical protein
MDFSATVQVRGVKWAVGLAVLLLVAMGVVAGESDEAEPVRVIWMMQVGKISRLTCNNPTTM